MNADDGDSLGKDSSKDSIKDSIKMLLMVTASVRMR